MCTFMPECEYLSAYPQQQTAPTSPESGQVSAEPRWLRAVTPWSCHMCSISAC